MNELLLNIKDLSVSFPLSLGEVKAVNHVNLAIPKGEVLGLVGESGCGKSTLGFSIPGLLRPPGRVTNGRIVLGEINLAGLPQRELIKIRGQRIGMIFQDPLTSLNPLLSIEKHFFDTIRTHRRQVKRVEARNIAAQMLNRLGIDPGRLNSYPHELSGGMRQRIMIGLGMVLHPDLLIADEPTTALDVIVEAQFLDLLNELRLERNLTILLISHNMGVVAQAADRVAVMYGGTIVESGTVDQVFGNPLHPYTSGLLASIPNIRLNHPQLTSMPGAPPNLTQIPSGCVFEARCRERRNICARERPPEVLQDGQTAFCWLYG